MSGCFGNSVEDRAAERVLGKYMDNQMDMDVVADARERHTRELKDGFCLGDIQEAVNEFGDETVFRAWKDGDHAALGLAVMDAVGMYAIALSEATKTNDALWDECKSSAGLWED